MENRIGYTILGPQPDQYDLPLRPTKSPSVRREPKLSGNNLRILYRDPTSSSSHRPSTRSIEKGVMGHVTPVLPPTPPNVEEDSGEIAEEPSSASDATRARSMLATPVHQISPPTPDNTPPREHSKAPHFLGAQPSISSTRAESFQTAFEEIASDKESDVSRPRSKRGRIHGPHLLPPVTVNGIHKPSPLVNVHGLIGEAISRDSSSAVSSLVAVPNTNGAHALGQNMFQDSYGADLEASLDETNQQNDLKIESMELEAVELSERQRSIPTKEQHRRGQSLRDRLEESRKAPSSPSIDKFASIIGWNSNVPNSTDENKRWSDLSTTSTVEALLVEKPQVRKRRNTLRHVSKKESLRSASSPLPKSNSISLPSASDSPHRLVHKKVRLGNHHRLSFGSEMSRSISVGSTIPPKLEVIKVAVIPERSSSLQPSSTSSRRHSHSTTGAPTSFRMQPSADHHQRRHTKTEVSERGRNRSSDRYYPPQVPPRSSSLSAPTSRDASRANSITSEHLRVERIRVEKDLRSTLDKMESERLAASLKNSSVEIETTPQQNGQAVQNAGSQAYTPGGSTPLQHIIPGTKEWADLRPPSMLNTPYSQPSFTSATPEISEARLISLSVHNNHSVQLIEPHSVGESHAVGEVRKQNILGEVNSSNLESPLRNPRKPPAPPEVHFIPSTPLEEVPVFLESDVVDRKKQRPQVEARGDSFAKALLRNVSLKHARNKKADQDLDSSLHPFWRPRPFWDDDEPSRLDNKEEEENQERGLVNNSLGFTQQRNAVTGPLTLVRNFSERRRNRKAIAKQSSYSSLRRLRTAKRLYRVPGLGIHLQLMSLRDVNESFRAARQRKEDMKREKRRDELRKKIGTNVVMTGDSRYMATANDAIIGPTN